MNDWEKLYTALANAGISVYPPGAHLGVCRSPYCVVRQAGSAFSQGARRHGWTRYRITLLVPSGRPSALGELYEQVRSALQPLVLRGDIAPHSPLGAVVTDDDFDALTAHCDYAAWFAEN